MKFITPASPSKLLWSHPDPIRNLYHLIPVWSLFNPNSVLPHIPPISYPSHSNSVLPHIRPIPHPSYPISVPSRTCPSHYMSPTCSVQRWGRCLHAATDDFLQDARSSPEIAVSLAPQNQASRYNESVWDDGYSHPANMESVFFYSVLMNKPRDRLM